MNIHDYMVKSITGEESSLSNYAGKVLLVVNTVTGCGFTPQHEGLWDMYETYRDQGLEILDFPCSRFGGQAPGTEKENADFRQARYGVTFPRFAKIEVNDENESPLYACLKKEKGGCNGKLKVIAKLVEGWTIDRIEEMLTGHTCGRRSASCADQLAKAVRAVYEEQKAFG